MNADALENNWRNMIAINQELSTHLSVSGACSGYARMRSDEGCTGRLVDGSRIGLSTRYSVSAQLARKELGGELMQFRCHMMADEAHGRVCQCVREDDSQFVPAPCPVLHRILDARGGRA